MCSSKSYLSDTLLSSNYKNFTCNWSQLQPFWHKLIADNDLSAVNSHATIVLNRGTSHSFLWKEQLIFTADLSNPSVTCLPSFSWADNLFIRVIMCRWRNKGLTWWPWNLFWHFYRGKVGKSISLDSRKRQWRRYYLLNSRQMKNQHLLNISNFIFNCFIIFKIFILY